MGDQSPNPLERRPRAGHDTVTWVTPAQGSRATLPRGQRQDGGVTDVLNEVADSLYGLPPGDFVGARNSRAKELVAAGDRQSAAAVRRLPKPSLAAWLANRLVRAHRDEVNKLIALRTRFEDAQAKAGREELHTLARQRKAFIETLMAFARDELAASGDAMTPEVQRQLEDTLDAAVADEGAAAQLRAGHLNQALHHIGFGGFDLPGGGVMDTGRGRPSTGGPKSRSGTGGSSARRRPTDSVALEKAQAALREAERDLRTAAKRHDTMLQTQRDLADRLAEAEHERTRAEADLRRAETRYRQAKERLEDS